MSDTIIRVENLSKKYTIGHQESGRASYKSLRESISNGVKSLSKKLVKSSVKETSSATREDFWALKDVSFEIKQGDRVGFIGRNGAGKSTLLKILSRITEPTSGRVSIKGRISSLLEVGTGFHPELTGRENVFLNGAVLGMGREEIKRKFDEIVTFAEVEKFLDTPVKRYSSGMYVRLAFAVAAHLEPEILIVDEVLAVGDLAFQKKCLGKMEDVSGQGRTILFVSHNMQAIRTLCSRGILLEKGQVISDTSTEHVLSIYNQRLREQTITADNDVRNPKNRRGSGQVRFTGISVLDVNDKEDYCFCMGDSVRFRLSYQVFSDVKDLAVSVLLRSDKTGEPITSDFHVISSSPLAVGTKDTVVIEWTRIEICPGEYPLYFWLGDSLGRPYDVVDDLTHPLVISVSETKSYSHVDPAMLVGYFLVKSNLLVDSQCC